MAAPALKQEASREGSRAVLAERIAKLEAYRRAHAEVSAACEQAGARHSTLYRDIEAAEAEIEDAKLRQREEVMASVMRGDDIPTNKRLEDAERRLEQLRPARAALSEARQSLENDRREREKDIEHAERYVREAAGVVLMEGLPALLAEAAPLRQRLTELFEVMRFITRHPTGYVGPDHPFRELDRQVDRFDRPLSSDMRGVTAASSAYAAAATRLLTDPDAPLPAIG